MLNRSIECWLAKYCGPQRHSQSLDYPDTELPPEHNHER